MTTDTYKTWGEMTPEEKSPLLSANYEGKTIEFLNYEGVWIAVHPIWLTNIRYRVKPEPKIDTMFCQWSYEKGGEGGFTQTNIADATHKITFRLVDGAPDCNSVKMEAL